MRLINAEKIITKAQYDLDHDTISLGEYEDIVEPLKNVISIPDNATNGDVIKAMFPNIDITEMAFTVHATARVTSNGVKGGISYDFWNDWWNAPFEKGGTE